MLFPDGKLMRSKVLGFNSNALGCILQKKPTESGLDSKEFHFPHRNSRIE